MLCKERKAGTLGDLKTSVFLIVWLIACAF